MKTCLLALYSDLRHNFTHRLATMKEKNKENGESVTIFVLAIANTST